MTNAEPCATEAAFAKQLVELAASPYRRVGPFAWRFARGKLAGDTLFATLLRTGAIPNAGCLVDLGCGQGLLAMWLHAARGAWSPHLNEARDASTAWPAHWPEPPKIGTYLGVDQSRSEIARAKAAIPAFARVFRGDVRTVGMTMLDRCDVVTILDVMQYLAPSEQEALLAGIAGALPPWGVLVLRVGDGAGTFASRWGNAVDLIVCAVRGHPRWRLHRRTLVGWCDLLAQHGFVVRILDDQRAGTPARDRSFANVLLRASRPDVAGVADSKPNPPPPRPSP